MASGKKYLSTEVSVHSMELEFVTEYLRFEGTLEELFYWLDHLPESLRPEAQRYKFRLKSTFSKTLNAAKLARPQRGI